MLDKLQPCDKDFGVSPGTEQEDLLPLAHAGAGRLRILATLLVAIVASGLIVLASSNSAFENPKTRPTTPNPTSTSTVSSTDSAPVTGSRLMSRP